MRFTRSSWTRPLPALGPRDTFVLPEGAGTNRHTGSGSDPRSGHVDRPRRSQGWRRTERDGDRRLRAIVATDRRTEATDQFLRAFCCRRIPLPQFGRRRPRRLIYRTVGSLSMGYRRWPDQISARPPSDACPKRARSRPPSSASSHRSAMAAPPKRGSSRLIGSRRIPAAPERPSTKRILSASRRRSQSTDFFSRFSSAPWAMRPIGSLRASVGGGQRRWPD